MSLSICGGIALDSIIYGNTKAKKQQKFAFNEPLSVKPEDKSNNIPVQETLNNTILEEDPEEIIDEDDSVEQPFVRPAVMDENRKAAHDTLFSSNTFNFNNDFDDDDNNQSARDILFGRREIPDITMPNDEERNRWMRDTKNELFNRTSRPAVNNSTEDLFGGTDIDSDTDSDDLYNRAFPTSSRLDSSNSRLSGMQQPTARFGLQMDDTDDEDEVEPLNTRGFSSRMNTARPVFGQPAKLGEDEEDVAAAKDITFNTSKPTKPAKGKQIGIKSVRYNSIPLSIFKTYKEANADYSEEYRRKSAAIENVMSNFNIGAKVINVVRGPKVTRYELSLPDGIPVTKVLALEKNIAMALAARSAIRIEAPIPGKNAFGIELENDVSSTVGMKELLENPEFVNCKHPLPIAIGKNINGQVIIKSLPKMIHLLVAGSSGSGKSVFIHTLLMSILYKYSPNDVRFIMIDPKRVEFTMYENLPHLMFPNVIDEHDKALKVLNWTVNEMEERYKLLKSTTSQNIEQYNKTPDVVNGKEPKMTYLVIVVDELAELMGSALKKDFEAAIQRITQLGRAAGIHMVLATQRPSVDVVNGTIKNNLPSRVAFALASAVDSKTVIDIGGAEKLLGQGDMLFSPQDMNMKIRLQAAYCDNDEIRAAISYIKENNDTDFDEELMEQIFANKDESANMEGTDALGNGGGAPNANGGMDEYMKLAVKYCRNVGKVSASMLQRKLRIGFNRAGRIVDEMIELGLVGPPAGSKPRDFSITNDQYRELFGEDFDDNDIF